MLIAKAMQEERYEDAQRILDGIPDRTVDKEERQAILYAREALASALPLFGPE